jgi:hypothetical protein
MRLVIAATAPQTADWHPKAKKANHVASPTRMLTAN